MASRLIIRTKNITHTHATHADVSQRADQAVASKRNPVHPHDVSFSPAWFGLGAVAATAWVGLIRRFGWPAAGVGGGMALLGAAYSTLFEPTQPVLERVTWHLPHLPAQLDGFRIGQLSDSHLGLPFTARNLRWAVKQMQREQPDLIVFTGDVVHRPEAIKQVPEMLRGLHAPLGVFAVSGNHDYWEGLDKLRHALASVNITMMFNQHQKLSWRGSDFWLLGTDDVWDGKPDLDETLYGVPHNAFTILMAHTPYGAQEAARMGVDLQLSGHTHGGHLRLPLLGAFAKPRYSGPYMLGRFQVGSMGLYVSRGLGGAPLRLLCRPEATIHTLRRV